MKISKVESFPLKIPLRSPFKIATGESSFYEGCLVKLTTDIGIIGWGEASPSQRITGELIDDVLKGLERLRDPLIGSDPLEAEALWEKIEAELEGHSSTKAAVDIALYDILGKRTNLKVKNILGGHKDSIETSITIPIKGVTETLKEAGELIREGTKVIKLKIGLNPEEDLEKVRRIRELDENVRLRVDANQGYTPEQAISVLREMEPYQIEFCEQPVAEEDLEGMKSVRDEVGIAIMADESVKSLQDAQRVAQSGACNLVNLKLMKMGGIRRCAKISSLLEGAGIGCMVGCMVETKVGITAGTHLALALANVRYADLDSHLYLTSDPTKGGIITEEGVNWLLGTMGLGIEVVGEKELAEYA